MDDLFDNIVKWSACSLLDEAIFGANEPLNPSLPVSNQTSTIDGATIQVMLAKNEMEHEKHNLLSSIEALKSELAAKNNVIVKKEEEQKQAGDGIVSSMKEEFTCVICQDLFIRAHTLSCSHSFCEWCIKNWLKKVAKKECPICRVKVTSNPVRSIVLDNAISKLEDNLSKEEREDREKVKEEHRASLEGPTKKGVPGPSSVVIRGADFGPYVLAGNVNSPIVLTDSTATENSTDESESEEDYGSRGYGGYGRCFNCV